MKKKNNGGRPAKQVHEKATKKVSTYLTESEFLLLEKRVSRVMQPRAIVIKSALLKDLKFGYREPKKFTVEEVEFLEVMSRLNSTLNQIARKLNSGIKIVGIESLKLLSSIDKISAEIKMLKDKI